MNYNLLLECSEIAEVGHGSKDFGNQLFASIAFPPPNTAQWEEQVYEAAFGSIQSISLFIYEHIPIYNM